MARSATPTAMLLVVSALLGTASATSLQALAEQQAALYNVSFSLAVTLENGTTIAGAAGLNGNSPAVFFSEKREARKERCAW